MNTRNRTSSFLVSVVVAIAALITASTASAAEIYDGASGNFNIDTWSTAANWNATAGPVPSGATDVEIAASEHASVLLVAPAWNGALTLRTNSILEMGNTSNLAMHNSIFSGVSTLTMESGSILRLRTASNTSDSYAVDVTGDAEYQIGTSTSAHHRNRTLSGNITGSGNLGIRTTNGQAWTLSGDNSGFLGTMYIGDDDGAGYGDNLSENNRFGLVAASTEALPDLLQVGGGGNLRVEAANTINDLNIFGPSSDEVGHFKLFLDGVDLTVNSATLNGTPLAPGTYNTGSGILDFDGTTNFFGGTGNLIVLPPPAAPTAPEPSTLILAALGLVGVVGTRRRRNRS